MGEVRLTLIGHDLDSDRRETKTIVVHDGTSKADWSRESQELWVAFQEIHMVFTGRTRPESIQEMLNRAIEGV